MTTIAYSQAARTMAADTQVSSGNRKFRTTKLYRLKDGGVIGGAGDFATLMKIFRWAERGFCTKSKPELADDASFEVLAVCGDGSMFSLDETMEPMPLTDAFLAMGSGSCYAVAAMHCGKTPLEAVEVAAVFDPSTSGPFETMALGKPKAKHTANRRK